MYFERLVVRSRQVPRVVPDEGRNFIPILEVAMFDYPLETQELEWRNSIINVANQLGRGGFTQP